LKTGRHFIHIDISPKYCKIAEDRLQAARLLKELPLSVGKPGRKIKISRYKVSEANKPAQQKKKKQLAQSRLLEPRGKYKPKATKTKRD
jgi:DNA modification methylase